MFLKIGMLELIVHLCISILEFKLDINNLIWISDKNLCISILEFKWNKSNKSRWL